MEKDGLWSILTFLVALYGAALSTFVYFRSIQTGKTNVLVSRGYSYEFSDGALSDIPDTLTLSATNFSNHEVVIVNICLEIPGFANIAPGFLVPELANVKKSEKNKGEISRTRLKKGDSADVTFDYLSLSEFIVKKGKNLPFKVRGVCETSLEEFYYTDWFSIGDDR